MKQVILYGLAGAEGQYQVVRYCVISEEYVTISNIVHQAFLMQEYYPTVESVYAIDNRYGLKKEYMESIKKGTIESCYEFKDILEHEGIRIR